MSQATTTQAKPEHNHKHAEGSSCSTDKASKTDAQKGSCSMEHKQGSCGSKQ